MTKRALIIGGSGQIGRAMIDAFGASGWAVVAAHRAASGAPAAIVPATIALDRNEPGALSLAVQSGFDVVIDTVAYDDNHARQWLEVQGDIGALVVISSASVYCDDEGKTLDEASKNGFPTFPVPITEDQPTVEPGPQTYSTQKVALEQTLLQGAKIPVTILRPCAIYGEASRQPREWWYIKRILDGRQRFPLAFDGQSQFHTSATANIAALAKAAIEAGGTHVLNSADPEALTVAQIGEAIGNHYGRDLDLVRLPGPPRKGVGSTPWSVAKPLIVDTKRGEALGYRPVTTYAGSVGQACRSAERQAEAGIAFAPYLATMFDYAAEDAALPPSS